MNLVHKPELLIWQIKSSIFFYLIFNRKNSRSILGSSKVRIQDSILMCKSVRLTHDGFLSIWNHAQHMGSCVIIFSVSLFSLPHVVAIRENVKITGTTFSPRLEILKEIGNYLERDQKGTSGLDSTSNIFF